MAVLEQVIQETTALVLQLRSLDHAILIRDFATALMAVEVSRLASGLPPSARPRRAGSRSSDEDA